MEEQGAVSDEKNGADQTMPDAVPQQHLLHVRHQCQWEGKGRCSPPSGHSSAIPPKLFIYCCQSSAFALADAKFWDRLAKN